MFVKTSNLDEPFFVNRPIAKKNQLNGNCNDSSDNDHDDYDDNKDNNDNIDNEYNYNNKTVKILIMMTMS